MRITLITVGKIKEKYWQDAITEYSKRLSRYCRLEILEATDEKTPDQDHPALVEAVLEKEGNRILKWLKDDTYVIALAVEGNRLSSEQLAAKIMDSGVGGISHITFIIGGSLGLSEDVIRRADYTLSFSDMTFPHQLMRVVLLEQIYRSFRIINGEPYHK